MDDLTIEQRKKNMQHIRSTETKPEAIVRKALFSQGFRYRKNDRRYIGKPDIVLPKYKTIIFIHGCFWHQHMNCRYATRPQSNADYWLPKLSKNADRDKKTNQILLDQGWRVIIVWECALKPSIVEKTIAELIVTIKDGTDSFFELPAN